MKTKFFLVALLMLVAMGLPNFASAGLPEAVNYLKSQAPDAWITQALIAAGGTNVPTSHLVSVTEGLYPTTDYAKVILALAAAGKNPTTFGEIDYVAKLKKYYDTNNNQMGKVDLVNDDIWSLLAFASITKTDSVEAKAAKDYVLSHQNADGGWGWDLTGGSDTNDTAAAIMALAETGMSAGDPVIVKALDYLKLMQNADGGFPYNPAWDKNSDSGSGAWVICALNKIGQNPASWDKGGNNPTTNLLSLQDTDGGFWWEDPSSNPTFNNKAMTPYAVIALAGKSFPIGYFEIPQPTRLTVNKSILNSGESLVITVEYFNDQVWSPLAGATIQGLAQSYTTDDTGLVSANLPAGDYNLSAAKDGYITSEQVKVSVLAPAAPAPSPSSGGSVISTAPTYCQSVEYDVWQNTCTDNWQYRNILTLTPDNCTLTSEQENQRKRACVAPEPGADNSQASTTNENIKAIKLEPEVLGVKIVSPSAFGLDEITAEANEIISGQIEDFAAIGTKSTVKLGSGERAGVLNSYKSAFGGLPQTKIEWEDVIRISNHQPPLITNAEAAERAGTEFKKVYQRSADMNNINDQTAINMIAYGLRPERRDLNLERDGIRKFVKVYKHLPVTALGWDTIRAMAYSGVSL